MRSMPDASQKMKVRGVVDLRTLNRTTETNVYLVPTQGDILNMARGNLGRYMSVFDTKAKSFYQCRVHHDDIYKLSVISPRNQENFQVAIMGFVDSLAYVQRQLDIILKHLDACCKAYVDVFTGSTPTCRPK